MFPESPLIKSYFLEECETEVTISETQLNLTVAVGLAFFYLYIFHFIFHCCSTLHPPAWYLFTQSCCFMVKLSVWAGPVKVSFGRVPFKPSVCPERHNKEPGPHWQYTEHHLQFDLIFEMWNSSDAGVDVHLQTLQKSNLRCFFYEEVFRAMLNKVHSSRSLPSAASGFTHSALFRKFLSVLSSPQLPPSHHLCLRIFLCGTS